MEFRFLPILFSFFLIFGVATAYAESVPDWVKNTAGWWANDAISETEFVNAIEFLIETDIIQVTTSQSVTNSQVVPDWVKNTAGWWANDAISETEFVNAIEFLIETGVISTSTHSCDPAEDTNHNGIPDEVENISSLKNTTVDTFSYHKFVNKNWENCTFPIDVSYFYFTDTNLTNADFSNSEMFGTLFVNVDLTGANFSNSELHGVTFLYSKLINVNFDNVDFGIDNYERPFYVFSHTDDNTGYTCYAQPCLTVEFPVPSELVNSPNFSRAVTFSNGQPIVYTNLLLVDKIDDQSDNRTIWRHITNFSASSIENSTFIDSNLSNLMFWQSKLVNLDFSESIYDNLSIRNSNLFNIQFVYNELLDESIDLMNEKGLLAVTSSGNLKISSELSLEKFPNDKNIDLDIEFKDAFDEIPINWSMGLTIYDKKLYVADTDNHRILIYDLNTLKQLTSFTSPLQHECDAAHAFAPADLFQDDCPLEHRNLPTSVAVLSDKIFVAYGFQNEIQVFDMNGTFLYNFGSLGDSSGEFNENFSIASSITELFVADSQNHRIQIFDVNGIFLREFSTNANSILNSTPSDLDIYENRIFVIDSTNSSVLEFDISGNPITKFYVNINQPETNLTSIDVHENLIFITDSGNDSILIFDLDGNPLATFGNSGKYYGEFNLPYSIVSDGSHIFISDNYNYRIQVFELSS